jgi:uncharacterized protein YigA (DUF484 family)
VSNEALTEQDIADWLLANPGFFERHAELLSNIQLTSPHGNRAVSLQERQIELQRDKQRSLEISVAEMIRAAQDNEAISARLHEWACMLMTHQDPGTLPDALIAGLRNQFTVPQAALRLWNVRQEHAARAFSQGVSADAVSFASSLGAPYVGPNTGFEAAQWLDDPSLAASIALIPLQRSSVDEDAFGLMILASPDAQRYRAGMGTDFLERIGELASAAMVKLIASSQP